MAVQLNGRFKLGFALDLHTLSSKPIDPENYIFDTKRSEIGQLLYELKYTELKPMDKWNIIELLAERAIKFLQKMHFINYIDIIIPVPPSTKRDIEHVIEIAKIISEELDIDIDEYYIKKTKDTIQMKNLTNKEEKEKVLQEAYKLKDLRYKNKNILLFDDVYQTGVTCNTISELLYKEGKVKNVYVLTLTKTKR
ncbi:ComF family protein [Persephonella sp.]